MAETEPVSERFSDDDATPARKRPRPGERRLQILQTLAAMLEQPDAERVTTASLAAKIGVSEAALYRHFASKAQMFEGLIDFVDQSVIVLIRQVTDREPAGPVQASRIVALLLQFAEKNPGMSRVMIGDALVLEHERLQERINLLFDKIEAPAPIAESPRLAHTQLGCPIGGFFVGGLYARPLAALCPLGVQALALRAFASRIGADVVSPSPVPQSAVVLQPVDRQISPLVGVFRRQLFIDVHAVTG